jgi:hypothetical protein
VELARLYAGFLLSSSDIGSAFVAATRAPLTSACSPSHELAREGAVVKLQDRWGAFSQDLVLLSAVGSVRTTSGVLIARRYAAPRVALDRLRATFAGRARKPGYWQPKWFDPTEAIDAANRLGIPNFAAVSAALGATPAPLEELRAVRNFFAHRGALAGRTARSVIGVATTPEVHNYLTETLTGGALRFEVWISTLQGMARASIS